VRWVMKAVRCAGTDDVSRAAKFLLKPRTYLVRLSHLTHRSRKLQGWLHVYAPIAGVVMYLLGKPVLVQLCKGLNTTGKSYPFWLLMVLHNLFLAGFSALVWYESWAVRMAHDHAKCMLGDTESSLGDAKSSLGDAKSSLGDAKSLLGDAKSSLGDAKSSLGDA
jgi:hypothetical protein